MIEIQKEMSYEFGEAIQFRKSDGWDGEAGEWRNGFFEGESRKCYFIRDAAGEVEEFWKHRIEIRKAINHRLTRSAGHGSKPSPKG